MKVSTGELKKELSKRHEKFKKHLTLRLYEMFYWLIHEELSEEREIFLFDLIVHIIFRADKDSSENIASLMVLLTPEKIFDFLDERTLSNSAAFIRDYLMKDYIYCILKHGKDEKLVTKKLV
ncbi:MAG: hypothetical protein OXB84_07200 [Halobacteriovoraceae bacterium]|nr:hypothetical protein [Halobacteriovoraceae bacterium]